MPEASILLDFQCEIFRFALIAAEFVKGDCTEGFADDVDTLHACNIPCYDRNAESKVHMRRTPI